MRPYFFTLLLSLSFLFSNCTGENLRTIDNSDAQYDYTFYFNASETDFWTAALADCPVGSEEANNFISGPVQLPGETGYQKTAYILSSHNYSDNLFMFTARKLDGLQPNTSYLLHFNVELASNTPRNSVGVGGSPGASVYLKAGALPYPPRREARKRNARSYWQVNFDKGKQANEGSDMQLLGNIGTNRSDFSYALIERNSNIPLKVSSNDTGELWVILGIDSGFEGKTTIFFTRLRLNLSQQETASF